MMAMTKKLLAKRLLALGAACGALLSSAAMAAPYGYGYGPGPSYVGPYLGASVGEVLYNEEGLSQLAPTIVMFRMGQQFSPYLAIEGRIGTSVNRGDADGFHVDGRVLYAGYVKGMLPLNPWFAPYAIAGIGGANWHRNYPDFDSNDVGVSFGFGGEFYLGGGAALNVEWARLVRGDNLGFSYDANQLTFGVNWRF